MADFEDGEQIHYVIKPIAVQDVEMANPTHNDAETVEAFMKEGMDDEMEVTTQLCETESLASNAEYQYF